MSKRSRALMRCLNVHDLRNLARRRIPTTLFHFLDGGADDEVTLHQNTRAFDAYEFTPHVLQNVSKIETGRTLLGREIALPIILSPVGGAKMFHRDGEAGVARAASAAGTFYSLSTMANTPLEEVAAVTSGPKIFQLYALQDRQITESLISRAKGAKYDALCLTVDTAVAGNRERDLRLQTTMPPRISIRNAAEALRHPRWVLGALKRDTFSSANLERYSNRMSRDRMSASAFADKTFDRSMTWRDAEWMAREWGGPFVLKGILHPDDAKRARDIGARAIVISNHGGRQLDGSAPPIHQLATIRRAVGSELELILEGGIRRGSHVLKALAMGADACSIGRAYAYGLAAAGQPGVESALTILREELRRGMALLGCSSVLELPRGEYVAAQNAQLVSYLR